MKKTAFPIELNLAVRIRTWLVEGVYGIFSEIRWRYIPPLLVYLAAGVSGFTGIIESFYVKEELQLTASFLASLGFWAGLPWALKMPLGHLVDLFWHRKSVFVYVGALLMSASLLIMVGLTGYKEAMAGMLPLSVWYVISSILSPIGFILQDVVADAMTVEAVPALRADGTPVPEPEQKRMHVTVQTLGRVAILGGSAAVAGLGGWLAQTLSYTFMYWISLIIPAISVSGVVIGKLMQRRRHERSGKESPPENGDLKMARREETGLTPNYHILGGSGVFALMTLVIGLSRIPLKQEVVFCGSLLVIAYLMYRLVQGLDTDKRREIICIAIIIFVFRAMPTAGAGSSWWQIDVLQFDEAFFGTLRQISAILAIVGMLVLRAWMARRPIPYLVVFLSVYSTVLFLPFLGMYYGLHEWTQANLGFGARTIAIVDTMADSPLGQVAMIPMLAWIAQEAPQNQKATYFAVMAAFTNLALSASHLGTKYLNKIFVIERGQYDDLGLLMISVALIGLIVPVTAVLLLTPARIRKHHQR